MNDISASHAELPRSAYFNHTLRRARTAAEQRSHRYVTLEHLLYALLDDPDAVSLLETMGTDVAAIRSVTSDAINHRMSSLVVPNGRAPTFSYKFDSLMFSASQDAIRLGRREIDGALAVVAVAKDPENNASAFLTTNGFNVSAALRYLGASQTGGQKPAIQPQAQGLSRDLKPAQDARNSKSPLPDPRNPEVDDVLASVRNLLEAGERRERGLPPVSHRAPNSQPALNSQPRPEPGFDRQRGAAPANLPALSGMRSEPQKQEPRLNQRLPVPVGNDPSTKASKKEQKRGLLHSRSDGDVYVSVSNLTDHIPRRMRVGSPETVDIRIAKEEAAGLFAGAKARTSAKAQITRAITVKVAAPEGGFFIETLTPETQWLFDRPSFLGDEAFGRWVYTVVPNESGRYPLIVQISSKDIDENGVAKDSAIPEQVIEVRVRSNLWRSVGGLLKTLFLLAAGGAITEGSLYLLKVVGKIPHMPWQ